jgi:hypothetical protein
MAWIEPQSISSMESEKRDESAVSWFVTSRPWIFRHADDVVRHFHGLGRFGERWHARLAELARLYAQIQSDFEHPDATHAPVLRQR